MRYALPTALISLRPGCRWSLNGDDYSGLNWLEPDSDPPSRAECESEMARLKEVYDNQQYQRDRAQAYPSIADQLDALYHGGYEGWRAEIQAIKDLYPKP